MNSPQSLDFQGFAGFPFQPKSAIFVEIFEKNFIMVTTIEMGHLATVNHQRAIKNLVYGLERLYQEKKINLEPLPETDIDPGNPDSKCPDLILQDNQNATVPVIIEVATNRGWKTDYRKLRRLMDETDFGIQEGFVLNFETGEWHKYSISQGENEAKSGWSDVLGLDFGRFTA